MHEIEKRWSVVTWSMHAKRFHATWRIETMTWNNDRARPGRKRSFHFLVEEKFLLVRGYYSFAPDQWRIQDFERGEGGQEEAEGVSCRSECGCSRNAAALGRSPSCLGGSGSMLPRKILKIQLSKYAFLRILRVSTVCQAEGNMHPSSTPIVALLSIEKKMRLVWKGGGGGHGPFAPPPPPGSATADPSASPSAALFIMLTCICLHGKLSNFFRSSALAKDACSVERLQLEALF